MDGAPHCRDAPWGVSEAAPTIQEEEGRSDARWQRSDLKTPGRPRTPWDFWGEIAAAETPHGASLQWGAPAVETDKLTPMPLSRPLPPSLAGRGEPPAQDNPEGVFLPLLPGRVGGGTGEEGRGDEGPSGIGSPSAPPFGALTGDRRDEDAEELYPW